MLRRLIAVFLATVACIVLVLLSVSTFPGDSDPVLAARHPDPFKGVLERNWSPLSQVEEVSCIVTMTTTDSLGNFNACLVGEDRSVCRERAATLADYDGLALIPDTDVPPFEERQVAVHTDWFRLDNAQIGARYVLEALPDRTANYNLGIIIYDPSFTPIITDANPVDNNRGRVVLEGENQGPYFFEVFQITSACSGWTYDLEVSFAPPSSNVVFLPVVLKPYPPPAPMLTP